MLYLFENDTTFTLHSMLSCPLTPHLSHCAHPQVDPTAWKMELEKVAPRLRILLSADTKDWRTNLEEVNNNSKVWNVGYEGEKRLTLFLKLETPLFFTIHLFWSLSP